MYDGQYTIQGFIIYFKIKSEGLSLTVVPPGNFQKLSVKLESKDRLKVDVSRDITPDLDKVKFRLSPHPFHSHPHTRPPAVQRQRSIPKDLLERFRDSFHLNKRSGLTKMSGDFDGMQDSGMSSGKGLYSLRGKDSPDSENSDNYPERQDEDEFDDSSPRNETDERKLLNSSDDRLTVAKLHMTEVGDSVTPQTERLLQSSPADSTVAKLHMTEVVEQVTPQTERLLHTSPAGGGNSATPSPKPGAASLPAPIRVRGRGRGRSKKIDTTHTVGKLNLSLRENRDHIPDVGARNDESFSASERARILGDGENVRHSNEIPQIGPGELRRPSPPNVDLTREQAAPLTQTAHRVCSLNLGTPAPSVKLCELRATTFKELCLIMDFEDMDHFGISRWIEAKPEFNISKFDLHHYKNKPPYCSASYGVFKEKCSLYTTQELLDDVREILNSRNDMMELLEKINFNPTEFLTSTLVWNTRGAAGPQ